MNLKVYCKYPNPINEIFVCSVDSPNKAVSTLRSIFSSDGKVEFGRITGGGDVTVWFDGLRIYNDVRSFERFVNYIRWTFMRR